MVSCKTEEKLGHSKDNLNSIFYIPFSFKRIVILIFYLLCDSGLNRAECSKKCNNAIISPFYKCEFNLP